MWRCSRRRLLWRLRRGRQLLSRAVVRARVQRLSGGVQLALGLQGQGQLAGRLHASRSHPGHSHSTRSASPTHSPLVCVKLLERLELAALLAEAARHAADGRCQRAQVVGTHLVALVVRLARSQQRAAAVHLQCMRLWVGGWSGGGATGAGQARREEGRPGRAGLSFWGGAGVLHGRGAGKQGLASGYPPPAPMHALQPPRGVADRRTAPHRHTGSVSCWLVPGPADYATGP